MKNEEEPSHDSTRRLSRPGQAAAAPSEKPSSSLFPEMMMEAIVDPANMQRAWDQVRGNRGAPGPDGITLPQFPEWLRPQWAVIRQQLLDGTYEPSPVRRKTIDKPDGGQRQLGIPNALGRLIQQAIQQVLTPVFDPGFSDSSHGFRPNRSAHGAAKQVQRTIRRGRRFVVDMDLSKFFDRVQHDVLMSRVACKVRDKRLLKLIGRYLRAGVMVEGVLQSSPEGTPQGGPLSPLLANILLDDLDKELERRGLPFVRYADDFVIFTKTRRAAERVFNGVNRYLTKALRLVVNLEKSRIVPADGVEFLGFVFSGRDGGDSRVGEERPEVQAADPGTDRAESRHLDDAAARGTPSILARLGRVLRAGGADATVRESRPVDPPSAADVLLKTLAVRPHAGSESLGARRSTPTGLPPRKESQRPLAHGQNHCQRGRDDECLAARSGTGVAEITLGQACTAPSNRVVRTRMLRGVGGGRSDPPAYPILPATQSAEHGATRPPRSGVHHRR
jgi:group II intron reverse transcriptase/maturase